MATNPYYPLQPGYSSFTPYQQPWQAPINPVQTTSKQTMMDWVDSEKAAESYPMGPNQTIQLWDKTQNTIYIKSTDGYGIASIRTIDFTVRGEVKVEEETKEVPEFVVRTEFDTFKDDVLRQINSIRSNIANPNNAMYRGGVEG